MKRTVVFFLICFAFSLSAQTFLFQENKIKEYKKFLIKNKDYYRAITETYREYFSKSKNTNQLNFELGQIYYLGKNYNLARNFFYNFLNNQKVIDSYTKKTKRFLVLSYCNEEDWRNALFELQDFNNYNLSDSEQIAVQLKSVELYTKIFNLKRANIELKNVKKMISTSNSNVKFLKGKIEEAKNLPYKNKNLALFLAAIPGMNLIYCHQYSQGIIAFLTQTVAAGLSYYSFRRGDWVTGSIVASTDLGWYFYNFHRAVDVLNKYNATIKNQFQTSFSISF